MSNWAVVILAAGKGTRMESDLPKVLHRVCGKEMIRHVADAVRAVHGGPLVVIVPQDGGDIRKCLGDSVEYVEQAEAKGTGHALLQAEKILRRRADQLLVLYADTPLLQPSTLARLMEKHQATGSVVTLLTSDRIPASGLGRIVRDASGRVAEVLEEAVATEAQRVIAEVNGGVYGFKAQWLWPALRELAPSSVKEYYLTDLVKMAANAGAGVESMGSQEDMEVLGVNDRVQLAQAEQVMRQRILRRWMLAGVTITDPATTYMDAEVTVGRDTTIYPNSHLRGATTIGKRCTIGPSSMIYDSSVGDDCKVVASVVEESRLESLVDVGPFSHLRQGTVVEREVHIGNYAEVKNSRLGRGTKMGHFSYIGDAEVGRDVNIGAGTITCNFDGVTKHRTIIEDNAFIGSDTMLIAPVRVGARSATGAGSVVTKDVPPDSVAVGVPARIRHKGRSREAAQGG